MAELNLTLDARHEVGTEATHQAEALLRELLRAAYRARPDDLELLFRSALPRLIALNAVAMVALDSTPEADSVDSLRDQLHGGYSYLVQAEGKS
jgi:hypothetical protein